MATWLFDPVASAASHQAAYKKPYPRQDWLEDRAWNAQPLQWIETAAKAYQQFSKDPTKSDKKEDDFYRWMRSYTG